MTSTSNSSISNSNRGPQLLLLSLAGAGTAAGISFTRWLLAETGEILLLFTEDEEHKYCEAANAIIYSAEESTTLLFGESIDNNFASSASCTSSSPTTIKIIGQSLQTISTSPHLRSIPLILLLLSSTTFFIGIILTHKQLRQLHHSLVNGVNSAVISVIRAVIGEEVGDDLEVRQLQQPISISLLYELFSNVATLQKEQLQNSIVVKMDNLIMDEYLHWFTQNGVELLLGWCGGVALYSLPEGLFSSCRHGTNTDNNEGEDVDDRNKSAIVRQRLIHAADPWLERVLFHRGGVWDVVPSAWRECLVTIDQDRKDDVDDVVVPMMGQQQRPQGKVKMMDNDHGLDTTQETLVGTEISAATVESTDNETDDDGHDEEEEEEFASSNVTRHAPPISSVEMTTPNYHGGGWKGAVENGSTMRESVGEALYATICDVVASNLTNAFQSNESASSKTTSQHKQKSTADTTSPPPPQPPSQKEQIEKLLHQTSIATLTIFLFQFLSSPSTRKSWMSAIKFLTSMGLFSTAISTGVASHLLRGSSDSNADGDGTIMAGVSKLLFGDSVLDMLHSKIVDSIRASSFPLYSSLDLKTISGKMSKVLHRVRNEIKKNKRLQATVALMILYGVKKQLPGRRGIRSGGKGRRVR